MFLTCKPCYFLEFKIYQLQLLFLEISRDNLTDLGFFPPVSNFQQFVAYSGCHGDSLI